MKQSKQERIEKVLSALDGVKRAEAPAFFYTRLKARMLARQTSGEMKTDELVKNWLLKPVFLIAALVIVVIINAFIYFQSNTPTTSSVSADNETSIQSIAAEYNLSDNVLEDINQ